MAFEKCDSEDIIEWCCALYLFQLSPSLLILYLKMVIGLLGKFFDINTRLVCKTYSLGRILDTRHEILRAALHISLSETYMKYYVQPCT